LEFNKTFESYFLDGKLMDITEENSLSLIINVAKGGELMQAYCVKCKAKKEMKNAKSITMKNGKPATQGVCPECGTKMFKIGKA
jgi:NAD-dependent SIR2 family protein deacetylase